MFYIIALTKDGELCISILHPPGEDSMSGELPQERWNPTQSVRYSIYEITKISTAIYIIYCICDISFRTILLSVISLLNEPNTYSAANVDASVLYRKWRDSRGKDKQYIDLIK